MSDREPRRVLIWQCFDCAWVGNRPVVTEGVVYGWEDPWTEYTCPECGESIGVEFWAVEDMRDHREIELHGS